MGLFGKILGKLGIGHAEAAEPASVTAAPSVAHAEPAAPAAAVAPRPAPIPVVDVEEHLERLAAASPEKLNWRTSIVDLLKLLDIESSHAARKELAVELGCPAEKMQDSASMNIWLHKTVLQKIAQNGGKVPGELLD